MTIVRPVFSIVFGLVLVISLSLKVVTLTRVVGPKPTVAWSELALLLEQQGFQTSYRPATHNDLTWVSGAAGACRVQVTEVDPQGWNQSLVAQVAKDNQLFYLFSGEIFSEQPTVRTRLIYYWNKLNRYVGINLRHYPVLAFVATPACQDLPLRELASL
ncbi:hypothetical protein [Microvirga arabica]|uniref:hypothetical protein n=1 Tax=Microvirga arabica TaxID=1128671 RepID=UPI00193A9D1D|nr:hypothetical protein [Microvirga arabica]MBM1175470.1 hypothetical protein [Microvirga arabica]